MIGLKVDFSALARFASDMESNLGSYLTWATNDAGYLLVQKIREVEGEYADKFEVQTDTGAMVTYVAPAPEYIIRDKKDMDRAVYAWRYLKCPFWNMPLNEKADAIVLEPIVDQSMEEIAEVIHKSVMGKMRYG